MYHSVRALKINGLKVIEILPVSSSTIQTGQQRIEAFARKLFPEEIWREISPNVFSAKSRLEKSGQNKQEKEKFEKEVAQAKLLADAGHIVFFVPEIGKGKHFDALFDDGKTLELRTITGNLDTLWKKFKDGIKKADSIFVRTSGKTSKEVYSKLLSEIKTLLKLGKEVKSCGSVFLWIDDEEKLHKWEMAEFLKKAGEML